MKEEKKKTVEETVEPEMVKEPEKTVKKKNARLLIVILVVLIVCGAIVGYCYSKGLFKHGAQSSEVQYGLKSEYQMKDNKLSDFDLYFLKLENEANKNIVYSPLSIKYALEMLSEGAEGNTKAQIDAILGGYKAGKYTNSSNMSLANALFVRDSFKDQINDTYIKTLQSSYGAEVIYDSFADAKAINKWVSEKTFKIIKKILEDKDAKDLDFALVNALAIDMEWINKLSGYLDVYYSHEKAQNSENVAYQAIIYPLDVSYYHQLDFENLNASVESLELGAIGNKYDIINELGEEYIRETVGEAYDKWLAGEGAELCNGVIECETKEKVINDYLTTLSNNYNKYAESTDFSYYVDNDVKVFAKDLKEYDGVTLEYVGIMPINTKLADFVKKSTSESLNTIISKIKKASLDNFDEGYITEVLGYIPTFKYSYQLTLKDDLKSLGITDAFDKEKADLSNITQGAYIKSANHKADIEFCNEGIKAAAATEIGGAGNAMGPGFDYFFEVPVKKIDITFDKPYMYLIRNKDTGEIWFTGQVYDPNHYSAYNQ